MSVELKEMTNREKMESLLDTIRDLGYTTKNVVFGNCYFIFEDEEDSVCHFEIKEIPGFKFGIWNTCRFDPIEKQLKNNKIGTWADNLGIHTKSELVVFTQYKRDEDKFKPSASGFVTGVFRQAWVEAETDDNDVTIKEEWYVYDLENILSFMKKHPIKSVAYTNLHVKHIWEDDRCGLKLFLEFIGDWIYHWKSQIKDYIKLKYEIYVTTRLAKKLTQSKVLVVDRGKNWSPRLDIFVRRIQNVNLDIYSKEELLVDKFFNKYFNRVSITRLDIDILADDIKEKDLEKDKNLSTRFEMIVDGYAKNTFEGARIIYDNMGVKK